MMLPLMFLTLVTNIGSVHCQLIQLLSLTVMNKQLKINSLFFSDAKVDIAMPSPCPASSHAISVKAFRWRI